MIQSINLHSIVITAMLTVCTVPSLSMAFPSTPSTMSSTTTIKGISTGPTDRVTTLHSTETPDDALNRLCGQNPPLTGDIALTVHMKSAAVEVLETLARNNPNETISRCVISVPGGGNLDEQIKRFNADKHWEEKYNTAFLLFGKGIRPHRKDPQKTCDWEAEKTPGDALPANWEDTFWIRNTINLESGQKLVGIPLDGNHSQFADGYYVNLQRRITATAKCRGESASFNHTRDSLITLEGAGNTITGLTNIGHSNQIKTFTKICGTWSKKTHKKTLNPQEVHFEVIKARFNPMVLPVNTNSNIIDIFNNQFFQYEKPVIDISIKASEEGTAQGEIVSDRLAEKTLAGIHDNRFYACQVSGVEKTMEPALRVNIDFHDASSSPEPVQALSLQQNHFLTDGNMAVNIKLSSNARGTINNNQLDTTQLNTTDSSNSLYGIMLTGITDTNRAALSSVTASFSLADNQINNVRVALALNAKLVLQLTSNRLLGTSAPIELNQLQTYPVTLAGDQNNEYLPSADFPCGNLDQGNIQGGIVFSDGTHCPSGWTPTLPTTPALTSSPVSSIPESSTPESSSTLQITPEPGTSSVPVTTEFSSTLHQTMPESTSTRPFSLPAPTSSLTKQFESFRSSQATPSHTTLSHTTLRLASPLKLSESEATTVLPGTPTLKNSVGPSSTLVAINSPSLRTSIRKSTEYSVQKTVTPVLLPPSSTPQQTGNLTIISSTVSQIIHLNSSSDKQYQDQKSGLGTGQKAGIGIGATVFAGIIIVLATSPLWLKRASKVGDEHVPLQLRNEHFPLQ
ncbi:hypothetical protein NX722_07655 [Endozoicomonas gorgoniicola]|uniref:Uncharacterized protein n=1 Tax=Endozoicomonas gorgoniicola TaxID=1234144 RepID=A0ABT3MTX4_9GAMM|nr:hypothetical protein [Endozoicomonas gorgoniicola]MCW7552523.1 hypothetical protein [Endozoicomonas gorgoniicola]